MWGAKLDQTSSILRKTAARNIEGSLEKFENHDHWIYSYEKRQRLNLEGI